MYKNRIKYIWEIKLIVYNLYIIQSEKWSVTHQLRDSALGIIQQKYKSDLI